MKLVGYKTTPHLEGSVLILFFFFFTVISLVLRVGMVENTYNPSTWENIEDDHHFETARIPKTKTNKTQKELSHSLAV